MPPEDPGVSPVARAEAKNRAGWVAALVLSASLAAVASFGALLVWHLVRRGRVIRERLGPPKRITLPDLEELRPDPDKTPPRTD